VAVLLFFSCGVENFFHSSTSLNPSPPYFHHLSSLLNLFLPMAYQIPDVSKIDINKLNTKNFEPDFIPNPTPADKDFYRQAVFNTGSVWLLGMLFGGAYGGYDGYRHAPGRSMRILSNSILNGISKRGSSLGNRVAVLGKSSHLIDLFCSPLTSFHHSNASHNFNRIWFPLI
jgi:hypothetical protein